MLREHIRRAKSSLLIRNAGWLFAGQGLSFVVQAASFIVLARLLQSSEYGILAGAVALVTIASQYGALGAGQLYMRYVSADRSLARRYWGNALLSVISIGGLLVALLWLIGPWLIHRDSLNVLILLALSECVFVQITVSASMVFQTFEKMRVSATLSFLTSALRFVAVLILLVTLGHAYAWQWALASLVISMLVAVTSIVVVTRNYGLPSFSVGLLLRRSGEGFVFAISGSTTSVYNDIDKVMLSHYGMIVANGIYSMAYRIVNIGTMPIMSLVGAAFPRFFQEGVNGAAAVVPMARKLLKRILVLGAIAVVGMFVLAPILPHLVGNSYREAVSALRWLCLIPIFRCFHLSAGDALSGAGDQKFRLVCQTIAAVGNGLLNLYLIPRYSWHGAAWASLLTDGTLGLMNWIALIYLARPNRSAEQRHSIIARAEAETLAASTHALTWAEKETVHGTRRSIVKKSSTPCDRLHVFVHLARGFGRSAWKAQWDRGKIVGINHDNPYGYRLAEEMGCVVQQSEDLPEASLKRLLRLAVRAVMGFDPVHAWSNRQGIFGADIVWTHTESQSLAVLLLARLFPSASKGTAVIAQTVWVMDNWESYSSLRRALYRSLLRHADILTFLSSSAAAKAQQLFPDTRVEFVRYGIRADQSLATIKRATHAPVRVLSLGNDRHRDWSTFITAIKNDSRYVARIATRAKLDKPLANVDNIHREKAKTTAELMELLEWADVAVVCLVDNLHASGITVIEEAVLCGLPVIATDVGGLRSYFGSEEIAYVPEKAPESLRHAIDSLMADDERRWRKAEQALARMKHGDLNSWSFVARHVKLSRKLLQLEQDDGCSEALSIAEEW